MVCVRRFSIIVLLSLVLFSTPNAWSQAVDTNYIAPSQVALSMVIQPPPPVGSELQKTDLAVVQKAQKTRTDAQTKRAVADNALTIFDFTSDTLGPNFVKEKLVVATPFFDRVYRDQIEACKEVKEHFNRQRPFVLDPEIKPIIKQPANASYPSGHSTTGYVYATVLAMMLPEKAQAIFDRAAEYGNNRIIAGVHFPTDVEAGKMSAAVIVNALVQQPLFVRDFERAKKEVRKVLDLK